MGPVAEGRGGRNAEKRARNASYFLSRREENCSRPRSMDIVFAISIMTSRNFCQFCYMFNNGSAFFYFH